MNAIRLYLDEDAAQNDLVAALRLRGVDVTSAVEADLVGIGDLEQLTWSTGQGRVLYTFNVGDFCALHAEFAQSGKRHAGLVVAPQQRYSVGGQMRRLLRLVATRTAEEMVNRIEFLSAWD